MIKRVLLSAFVLIATAVSANAQLLCPNIIAQGQIWTSVQWNAFFNCVQTQKQDAGIIFSATVPGLVPSSGGGTTNFLRADGTFAAPPAGAPGSPSTSLQYNNAGAFGGVSGVTSNGTAVTFATGDLLLSGSSSGTTTFNAAATAGGTATVPNNTGTIAETNLAQTWSAVQTHNAGDLVVAGATSGTLTINCAAVCASNTITFPAGTTNFSSTGGAHQVVEQTTSGGALTVAQLACADLSNSATGCSNTSANPSATIGLAAVNGSAATYMTSDSAPALSQTIAPTWTGIHTFAPSALASPSAVSEQFAASVVAGTSNTAGVNTTFNASQGTGTGAGGKLIFQVAPAGGSGTSQNALVSGLTIDSAGNFRFGAADAAAPVSQTFITQNVVAGTSNTAGANLTLEGSQGTGTGAGGSIIFQVAPAGGSGTSQNALANALKLASNATYTWGAADAAAPVAQTFNVQNVVGGTSNTAGANFTFNGSQGTGTGAGGKLIFQVAPAGTSGTSQNAEVNALQISTSVNSAFTACCSNTTELDTAGGNEVALGPQGLYWANGTTIGGGLRSTGVSAIGFALCSLTCGGDKPVFLTTAPSISSGFGTSPSIVTSNGTAAFEINVGTGGTATTGTIGMPPASNGWACTITDVTTQSATVFATKQTGLGTTTTVPIGNFNTSGAAAAWVASDKLLVQCAGY